MADVPPDSIYNMDEIGFNFTGHRLKVLTSREQRDMTLTVQQITPDGDGKMKNHVTGCLTTSARGLYRDDKMQIQGAPGLFLIHTNGSSTKVKEQEERERQRMGEEPAEKTVKARFTRGMGDEPETGITTTSSGSMTQEAFVLYADHFLESLPDDHAPIIFFLDGHGSRWTVNGLRKLIERGIFPFFIPSHTSIWAQPNDCKVNRRLHEFMEMSAREFRRASQRSPNCTDYNLIIKHGWRAYRDDEHLSMNLTEVNNATKAYHATGIYPFNWDNKNWNEATETLGQADGPPPLDFQIVPVERRKQHESSGLVHKPDEILSVPQKEILRDGMGEKELEGISDLFVAELRAREILRKWREGVQRLVDEGEKIHSARKLVQPMAHTEAQRLAMTLVKLLPVNVKTLKTGAHLTKEEREERAVSSLLQTTRVCNPISLTYFGIGDDREKTATAIKLKQQDDKKRNKWLVCIDGELGKVLTEEELRDKKVFLIKCAFLDSMKASIHRNKVARQWKRIRKQQAVEGEQERQKKALMLKDLAMRDEYALLIQNSAKGTFNWIYFEEMIGRWSKPFVCEIDNCEVWIGQRKKEEKKDPIAVMMKESALNKIMTKLLDNKKREADEEHDRINKRRKPNEQTVPTQNGEHGMHARYRTQRRDGLQVDQRQQKDAKALMTKLENAKNLLQDYDTQLRKFNERHPRTTVPVASDDGSEDADDDNEHENPPSPEFWGVTADSYHDDLNLFCRLFKVKGFKKSGGKQFKWDLIPTLKLNETSVKAAHLELLAEFHELDAEVRLRVGQEENTAGQAEDVDAS
jgi:hypothetical protein